MARDVTRTEYTVTRYRHDTTYHCSKCNVEVFEDTWPYLQDLRLYLNPDACVNQAFRLEFCQECLGPIWAQICELLGVDPEDESKSTLDLGD